MVAAMHMSLAQQKAACLGKPVNGKQPMSAFKAIRPAQRGMSVVRNASAAVAPPATGVIKEKSAELAINGEFRDERPSHGNFSPGRRAAHLN